MDQLLLPLIGVLVVVAVGFGVAVLLSGRDPGLEPAEPDGRAVPLPGSRPLAESDVEGLRFDTVLRGYRMAQVDAALRRAAYDIGYKEELIRVLEAEVDALRDGRNHDAEALRRTREAATSGSEAVASGSDKRPAEAAAVPDPDEIDLDVAFEEPDDEAFDERAEAAHDARQRQETKLG
jgi:DivIVA domain-containing protein